MKLNKPVNLLLVFLAFSSLANAQNALVVNKSDGDSVNIFIDEIQSLIFSAEDFQIKMSDGTLNEYMYDETWSLKFAQWEGPNTSTTSLKLEENNLLSLYPNPVNDLLFINMQLEESHNLNVEIIDVNGKIVYQRSNLKSNTGESISLAHLQQGIYFCRIQNGETVLTKKIIKK